MPERGILFPIISFRRFLFINILVQYFMTKNYKCLERVSEVKNDIACMMRVAGFFKRQRFEQFWTIFFHFRTKKM